MKKRRLLFISVLFAILFCVISSSCTLGGADSNCHGLCNNGLINVPKWLLTCYNDCMCSGCEITKEFEESAFTKEDYQVWDVGVCDNSEGNGKNGYVTVRLKLDFPRLFQIPYADIHYLTYKVNVYDDGVLAGSGIVVRNTDEIKNLRETYVESYPVSDMMSQPLYVDYFNVEITDYVSGNFTCTVEYVEGRYIK